MGGEHFCFTDKPLSIERAYTLTAAPASGAVVTMVGTVRASTGGRAVAFLDYEAFEPMALDVFAQIARQIRERWPATGNIVIHHRLGRLMVGEASVIIAVGNAHRADAFAACQYAIDTLKLDAPIWKKEHWADGDSDWVVGLAVLTEPST
ncbi:molybdenum cofactor biosynthesis protein MoaE [Gloeobacter violaceus]|uniref:Molybdopterin synthase catalytic subunit n=1 Tax=Gloeobacter violaceus (strain ATCC 29082 / PCC 7421) TaxID=251221 RepID=Q7ND69_GLOVI|nr:molybdenum cofactor biosynthesis protein MoaE [Gloeobacter violaceus]BAC92308.1 molybdopterin converting factor subunit 2 [Gloeobacter violaceus PCC 7421]